MQNFVTLISIHAWSFEVVATFIRILLSLISAHVSPFSSEEEWRVKRNTAVLFRLWDSWRWKCEDDRDRLKRKDRESEESRKTPKLTLSRENTSADINRASLLLQSAAFAAVSILRVREREGERNSLQKGRQKDVENPLSLFWGRCRILRHIFYTSAWSEASSFWSYLAGSRSFSQSMCSGRISEMTASQLKFNSIDFESRLIPI